METFRLQWKLSMFSLIKSPNASGQVLLIPLYLLLSHVWSPLKAFYLLPLTFIFWLSKDLAFTLWTTHTHREAPQNLSKGFCTKSLNSDIRYWTLFLMTFAFKLQFRCAVLSLQMVNRPFSLHLDLVLQIFLAWKFNEGEKEEEFNFCRSLSFLPFSCISSSFDSFFLSDLVQCINFLSP